MEFRVLLVDDEERLTAALSQFFLERGYKVLQAYSGDEALAILQRKRVDLIVLDLHMPGIPGEEILKAVKAKDPHIKVVVLTAYKNREEGARAAGCDAFFTKPFAVEELVERAELLLTQKDEDELKKMTMGAKVMEAFPGEPLAMLLLVEPFESVAQALLRFLCNSEEAKGVYKVEHATGVEQAIVIMISLHPDIVLVNALAVNRPEETIKKLLECPIQPKDYVLYMDPKAKENPSLGSLPAKRWQGSPWKDEDLEALAQLIRKTALEHNLVKR